MQCDWHVWLIAFKIGWMSKEKKKYILSNIFYYFFLGSAGFVSLKYQFNAWEEVNVLHFSTTQKWTVSGDWGLHWYKCITGVKFGIGTFLHIQAATASNLQRSVSTFWLIGWRVSLFLSSDAFINFLSVPMYHSWRVLVGCCQMHVTKTFLCNEKKSRSHFPFLTNYGAFSCQHVTAELGSAFYASPWPWLQHCIHFIH